MIAKFFTGRHASCKSSVILGLGLTALFGIGLVNADPADEALLMVANAGGRNVYFTCILHPPVTPNQKAVCQGLYDSYNGNLSAVNDPFPLVASTDPDPYSWSPYDVCRYETGHIVFDNPVAVPYCPTI